MSIQLFEGEDFASKFERVSENELLYQKHINLTRREYFAGLAMQGLLAMGFINEPDEITAISVDLADRLINNLNKHDKKGN